MSRLTTILATLIAVLLLTVGGQALYIVNVHRQSAVWVEKVAADTVVHNAFQASIDSATVEIAARDSVILSLRGAKAVTARRLPVAKATTLAAKAIATDTAKSDSVRVKAYEAAVAALEITVATQASIISYQEREIQELKAINSIQEEQLGNAIRRVVELRNLIEAAPAVQVKEGSGNVFKVIGGFIAGMGVVIITGLTLR